jgi:hypothetical protein
LTEAPPEVFTAALGHELAHVRRGDFACNLAYELLYLPVSFHPAAALVKRRINQTRELACDEMVSERLMDAQAYARSLVSLAGSISSSCRPTFTLGINDADILEERVMRLIVGNARNSVRFSKALVLAAAVSLGAISITAGSFTLRVGKDQKMPESRPVRQISSTWGEERQNLSAREMLDKAMNLNRAGRWLEAAQVTGAVLKISAASHAERCEAYTSGAYAYNLLGEKDHALHSVTLFEKECADLPADCWQSQEARRIRDDLNGIAPTTAIGLNRAGRWAEAAERAQEILNTGSAPHAERCEAYVDAAYAYVRLRKREQAAGMVRLFEQECSDMPTDHWQHSELRKLKAELE